MIDESNEAMVNDMFEKSNHSQDGLKAINPECNSQGQDLSRSRKVRGQDVGENPTPDINLSNRLKHLKEQEQKFLEMKNDIKNNYYVDEEWRTRQINYTRARIDELENAIKEVDKTIDEWAKECGINLMLDDVNELKKRLGVGKCKKE